MRVTHNLRIFLMGGLVSVTIREENGTVHKMCRHTNQLKKLIINEKLYQKDKDHIQSYLNEWYSMVDDFNQHKEDKEFEIEFSDWKVPKKKLAPHYYGLVVIDLKNDLILTSQSFTSFDRLLGSVNLEDSVDNPIESLLKDDKSQISNFKRLVDAGRIHSVEVMHDKREPAKGYMKTIDTSKYSLEDFQAMMLEMSPEVSKQEMDNLLNNLIVDEHHERAVYVVDFKNHVDSDLFAKLFEITTSGKHLPRSSVVFYLVDSPFQIEEFDCFDVNSKMAFRERLLELGFNFDEVDEKGWRSFK